MKEPLLNPNTPPIVFALLDATIDLEGQPDEVHEYVLSVLEEHLRNGLRVEGNWQLGDWKE